MILKTSSSSLESTTPYQQQDDKTKTEFPQDEFENDKFEQQTTATNLPSSVQDIIASEKPIGE